MKIRACTDQCDVSGPDGGATYVNKMAGLRDQFGTGCEIVRLDEGAVSDRIRGAIDRAWADAEVVRPAEPRTRLRTSVA